MACVGAKTNVNERGVAEQLHGGDLRTTSSAGRSRIGARRWWGPGARRHGRV